MQLFVWDHHFSTGLPELDEQHKALIDVFNRLHDTLFHAGVSSDEREAALRGELGWGALKRSFLGTAETDEFDLQKFGDSAALDRYDTIFVDSITVAGRLCFQWCKGQPEAVSEKTGKPDVRGAYGLHGREMIAWLTHLQHTRGKNVWFVGILDEKLDDFNRKVFVPQIDGSKTGLELPGIVDEVLTLTAIKDGKVTVVVNKAGKAGPATDGSAADATMRGPKYVTMDAKGNVLILDTENHCLRLYDPVKQTIRTIVGNGKKGATVGADWAGTQLNRPHGARIGPDGRLYVTDTENNRILIGPAP